MRGRSKLPVFVENAAEFLTTGNKKLLNCKVKFHPSMEFNPAKRCTSKGGI